MLLVGKGSFSGDLKKKIASTITHASLMAIYCKKNTWFFQIHQGKKKREMSSSQPWQSDYVVFYLKLPRLPLVACFPALAIGCVVTTQRSPVLPESLFVCFPKFVAGCMFSRACYWLHGYPTKFSDTPRGAHLFSRVFQ